MAFFISSCFSLVGLGMVDSAAAKDTDLEKDFISRVIASKLFRTKIKILASSIRQNQTLLHTLIRFRQKAAKAVLPKGFYWVV